MISNSGRTFIVITFFFVIFGTALRAGDREITINPEKIQLSGSKEIQTFKVVIISEKPIKAASFTFEIKNEVAETDIAFFARNVKWKKTDNTYRFIDIYGKTARLPIRKEPLELEITVKARKGTTIEGFFRVHTAGKIAAEAPFFIKAPFNVSAALGDFYKKYKTYLFIFILLLVLIYIGYRYSYTIKKRTTTLSTKANFSTLVKQNEGVVIEEFDNPFSCRLAGLHKKIKLSYRGSEINIWVGGSFHRFSDTENVRLKINRSWEIAIETQSFETNFGNQNNLVIYLNSLT